MKRTIKKYKKWPLSRKHKKTIKLRHKKYTGGTKTKTPKRKPLFKIVEQFDHELASAVDSAAQKTQDILQNASLAAPNELLSILPFESILPIEKTVLPIEKTVPPIENSLGMDLKTFKEEKHKMPGRLNETFIDLMEQLSNIMMKQGEPFKARAYQKAQETIMSYHGDITSPEQLKGLPAIGSTIMEKLNEYMQTGTLRILEREKSNPVNILGEIYGIGPKKAKELVDGGITTIAQLRAEQNSVLNATQKIGLKYYEDIMKRIPRAEIDHYNSIFKDIFSSVVSASASDSESRFEIVGSYRRGAQSSGDIDMIITSKTGAIFKKFIDELIKNGIILEVLSRGDKKCLVIAKLPGAEVARRVDFLYTSPEEYPFSVLYFTGSKIFNTVMRGRALSLGYSLNEHEMTKMNEKIKGEKAVKGEKVKGLKVAHVFTSEKDIFDFLGMVYREPSERIDGRSVILTANVGQIEVAPLPVSISEKVKEEKEEKEKKKGKVATLKNVKKMIGEEGVKTLKKPKTLKKNKEVIMGDAIMGDAIMGDAIMGDAIELINNFKKNGIQVLESLTEPQLSSMVAEANKAFHFDKTPLMTDNEFDIMKEFLEKKFPDSEALKEVGTPIIEKNKVTLPYEMASMDKIKPDTGSLVSWKQKYAGPYVISCKLDGVSGMYSTEGGVPKLYTRGNGKVGQDISHFIPFLRLPPASSGSIVVRGEFVIPKKVFHDKYSSTFANPRNFVAGIVNRQTIDESVVHDLHFVAYEVIVPQLKPSAQMQMLVDHGFEAVMNRGIMTAGDLTNELLSETLIKWRAEYLYEIDGVIVTDDKIYNRAAGNPEHSFAFKMVLSDQIAEAKVVDVIWTPSKDGYLKPRVQIEPIQLGGVRIEYATGFNAAFIEQNKIGVGALIQIIRSGDVIPHIRGVTVPAVEAKMPSVPYVWNATHVDIMLEDAGADSTVREKNIAGFFKGIGVDGLSSGNVARIIAAGYDSVPAIIHMTKADFEKAGFKTLAQKFVDGIRDKLAAASLIVLMSASNIFGRGFSEKRVELILEAYPDILVSPESPGEKVQKIAGVKGMATKTAEAFVEKIPEFVKFIGECGLQDKLVASATAVETSHPLYKKTVVMTGVRDPGVSAALKSVGANLGTAVSKNTVAVIANNPEGEETGKALTGKALDAKKLGIPIMTPAEFMSAYFS